MIKLRTMMMIQGATVLAPWSCLHQPQPRHLCLLQSQVQNPSADGVKNIAKLSLPTAQSTVSHSPIYHLSRNAFLLFFQLFLFPRYCKLKLTQNFSTFLEREVMELLILKITKKLGQVDLVNFKWRYRKKLNEIRWWPNNKIFDVVSF